MRLLLLGLDLCLLICFFIKALTWVDLVDAGISLADCFGFACCFDVFGVGE